MGLLKVRGTIDVGQFWPGGESDADTAKVIVKTTPDAFQFQPHPGAPLAVTHAFRGAKVKGRMTKDAIDGKGRITIRLQGIDAPELHYRPSPLPKQATPDQRSRFKAVNRQYRQHLGETAAVELGSLVKQAGTANVPCFVTTIVDKPSDVFDVYGRFVGDIAVTIGGSDVNVNRWLVEQGWAFPAFYNSMTAEEIGQFLAAAKKGRTKKRIWQHLQKKVGQLDVGLVYRRKGATPAPAADKGPLLFPKLFRRLCTWTAYRKAGYVKGNFAHYLTDQPDPLFLTKDFLEQGPHAATERKLNEFLKSDDEFTLQPEQMVFKEQPSKLVGPDGKAVTGW
jgi:endonuclease YncB( thermonuclease family)